jgi:hypothetical protein
VGKTKLPEPVKLFAGLISNDAALMEAAKGVLEKRFGTVDFESELFDFDFTTYYNKEMGSGLKRKLLTFKKLLRLENIKSLKILTNNLERKFSAQGKRRINIDPGYISLGKLVLLTTKDHYHRLYLGKGIYAEVTLYYKDKGFQSFEWSYPDYKSKRYTEFFNKVRKTYHSQLTET